MAGRVSTKFPLKENEVVRRLKRGRGNVAGIKCLIPVNDVALVPVEVLGIDFYHNGYRGKEISVRVKPTGGHGLLWVTPGELLDDTPDAKDVFDRKCKAAERRLSIKNSDSKRERNAILIEIRAEMSAEQRAEFDEKLPDRVGNVAKTDPVKALRSIEHSYEADRIADLATRILYQIDSSPEYD